MIHNYVNTQLTPELWNTICVVSNLPSSCSSRFHRCTKIINADSEDPKYIINVKQFAKFVVDLSDQVAPTDIEEGMRVGYVAAQFTAQAQLTG